MKFEPIEKVSIPKQIVEYIFKLVAEGKLNTNDRLPSEREISKTLSISRATLREGMSILKSMGFIKVKNGISYLAFQGKDIFRKPIKFQLSIMKDNYLELFETRKFLEIAIAGIAAERAQLRDIELLTDKYREMRENCQNFDKYIQDNVDFHILLAKSTQNIILLDIYISLREVLLKYQYDILNEEVRIKISLKQHRSILEAIKRRDSKEAMQLMEIHIKTSEETLKKEKMQKFYRKNEILLAEIKDFNK